ncbi:hypothetical protein [Microbacterium oleivorans]|uniref:Ethanolamine utilization protein, possible chaperonin n=1 Tax=Microbacterium oleivorans TaxID=273677 RepID=A0A031FXK5_9MICO|nr:hypothetical protein [Microbacterium oleivorans]EZP28365.1 Ethanolamine utilization protein, possible chaperonin [Microbacterium oleivorans]THE07411.1 hypothetical protein E1I21_07540 [Microbacterium oleivorans]
MPFHSKEMLEQWLEEFAGLGYSISDRVKVVPQDGADGLDTGLIALNLLDSMTLTYIQPEPLGSIHWGITFEARELDLKMNAGRTLELSGELAMVSILCTFLQTKSLAEVEAEADSVTPETLGL